jgi:hypothetical protein
MMRRRDFIGFIGATAALWPASAYAQQSAKVARVGFLWQAGPDAKKLDAFRAGLREAGYVEGQNVLIEEHYASGAYERLGAFARELVRSKVDVHRGGRTCRRKGVQGHDDHHVPTYPARQNVSGSGAPRKVPKARRRIRAASGKSFSSSVPAIGLPAPAVETPEAIE